MVFHKYKDEYEVGIAVKSVAINHKFAIKDKKGDDIKTEEQLKALIDKGNSWRLEVINGSGAISRDIRPVEIGHQDRMRDNPSGQLDFSWIVDFESKEFHADQLKPDSLIAGKLQPIIHLSNGKLYTEFKIEKLKRKKGQNGDLKDFGFLTETVGLDITLKQGEALVLRVENRQDGEVFKIPYREGGDDNVFIMNTQKKDKMSHFTHYYQLFSPNHIKSEEQYDIDLACSPELPPGAPPCQRLPLNPHPVTHQAGEKGISITIADYPCGGILLGTRTEALK